MLACAAGRIAGKEGVVDGREEEEKRKDPAFRQCMQRLLRDHPSRYRRQCLKLLKMPGKNDQCRIHEPVREISLVHDKVRTYVCAHRDVNG